MSFAFTGGCACGAIGYRLACAPYDSGWCHCRTCELTSGAPAIAFSAVRAGDFRIERGADKAKWFASTSFGRRMFCSDCGTLLAIGVDFQPDDLDFTVATLDDPGQAPPGFHIFYASRIPWAVTGDDLPRHARFRPDTRGLGTTEPPA